MVNVSIFKYIDAMLLNLDMDIVLPDHVYSTLHQ